MRLSLLVEAVDGAVDGTVEVIGVGKAAVGEVVPLEITPARLDRIELGRILGVPPAGDRRRHVPSPTQL